MLNDEVRGIPEVSKFLEEDADIEEVVAMFAEIQNVLYTQQEQTAEAFEAQLLNTTDVLGGKNLLEKTERKFDNNAIDEISESVILSKMPNSIQGIENLSDSNQIAFFQNAIDATIQEQRIYKENLYYGKLDISKRIDSFEER
jgi:hypothetical protein